MRLPFFLFSLCSCVFIQCASDETAIHPNNVNESVNTPEDPLISYIDFRVENYALDTLENYKTSPDFFERYIKRNRAFRINNNNPLVDEASIDYYVVDTITGNDVDVFIILESADTETLGSQLTAIVLEKNGSFKSSTLLALSEENDAWKYYWRSYVKDDTLHRLSTGMGDPDTTRTRFLLNGFNSIEVID